MKRIYFIFVLALFSIRPAFSADHTSLSASDYDLVCQYFNQLQDVLSKSELTTTERGNFIASHVNKNLKQDSVARALWNVIIYAVPDERYVMFKTTTEEQTKKPWDCASMKNLAKTAGE